MGVANTQLQKLAGLQRKLLVSENKTESICKVYKKKLKKYKEEKWSSEMKIIAGILYLHTHVYLNSCRCGLTKTQTRCGNVN